MNELSSTTVSKPRVLWIDCAKFLGIVLVVIGHILVVTDMATGIVRGLFFSFHMPLFFILSFLTISLSDTFSSFFKNTKKRAIHLLIPFLIFLLIDLLILILYERKDISSFDFYRDFLIYRLIGFEGNGYASAGSCWFFLALFVGQTMFDFFHLIQKKDLHLLILSVFFTSIGVILGRKGIILAFELDMILSSFIFFFVGYKLRYFDFNNLLLERFVIFLLLWLSTFFLIFFHGDGLFSYYEIWMRRYPLFPISFLCALFGSMSFIYFCIFISKIKILGIPLAFLGTLNVFYIVVHSIHQNHFLYNTQIFSDMNHYVRNAIFLGICVLFVVVSYLVIKVVRLLVKKGRC